MVMIMEIDLHVRYNSDQTTVRPQLCWADLADMEQSTSGLCVTSHFKADATGTINPSWHLNVYLFLSFINIEVELE